VNTAVLVIDVQKFLCSGKYEVHDSRGMIARINQVIHAARAAGAPVFFIQHEEAAGPLQHGLEGWALDPELQALETDPRVRKKTCDSFNGTPLQSLLEARGVRELVVCGLQSEFCVDSTVRRALALGYPVTLVADGHSTLDNGVLTAAQIAAHHNATLANLDSFGPRVKPVPAAAVRFGG
jgi:nicotinamidase-related amidase